MQRTRVADGGVRTVDISLRLPPDAGADECNPREYWRLREGERPRLLAVDCDEQRSAEDAAAAATAVTQGTFVVEYVEFQASDRCERYQARLDLTTLAVMSDARWEGTTDAGGCHSKNRVKRLAPHGDGSPGRPILRLHVDWGDVNDPK